jgi:acyl carrier protein
MRLFRLRLLTSFTPLVIALGFGCSGTYSPIEPSHPPDEPDPVLERRVIEVVKETFHVRNDTLPRSIDYFRDLRASDATHAELMIELGREFGIAIPAEHATQLRTIGQTIDYLQEALAYHEIPPDTPRSEQQERIPD